MKNNILPELARSFAIEAHGDQLYGTGPYSDHLDDVAAIAHVFGENAKAIAYLHDVIEDTAVQIEHIEEGFGLFIARCVELLTDESGKNRKERKQKTYAKLSLVAGNFELALIVKTADRLANVRSGAKNDMYKKEHEQFKHAVYRQDLCESLWQELDEILSSD